MKVTSHGILIIKLLLYPPGLMLQKDLGTTYHLQLIIIVVRYCRCCALYPTSQSDALIQILNGVDIVVATPTSLINLMKKGIILFKRLKHLVRYNHDKLIIC